MKKQYPVKKVPREKKIKSQLNPVYYLIMMAYLVIPTYLPTWYSLDANGPKFLAMAILNLVALAVFLNDPGFRSRPELRSGFFRNFIGIAYTLLMVFSMLSFFNAINVIASVMNFTRVFTVFASAYMFYVIVRSDRGYLLHLAVALNIILLADSLSVFYEIARYIHGDVASIMDIKTVYSHKNVLASSLFIKIPAAMFLIFYYHGWFKPLGYVAVFCGIVASFMLSTRAFYLGLTMLLLVLLAYAIVRYLSAKEKGPLRVFVIGAAMFILAIVIYSATQHYLFPKNKDKIWNTGIVSRMKSISISESSTDARLDGWKRSLIMFKKHPLLGVGSGNWKVAVLEYENQEERAFDHQLKAHNDFIEFTTETGIFGGLAYLSLFALILAGFISAALKPGTKEEYLKYLFIPSFGMLLYSVDAFFNFPADRPEIQVLFALYLALGMVFSEKWLLKPVSGRVVSFLNRIFVKIGGLKLAAAGAVAVLALSVWILIQLSVSLYYQVLARVDNFSGTNYKYSSAFMMSAFPSIPNLTCLGEPIAVGKARYLIVENHDREAINLLLRDNSSPFDSRRDYYLSMEYDKLGMADSAIFWGLKAHQVQPLYDKMVIALCDRLFLKGRQEEAIKITADYLAKINSNPDVWMLAAKLQYDAGHPEKALQLLDTASVYIRGNKAIDDQRTMLQAQVELGPFMEEYKAASSAYSSKDYPKAIALLDDLIKNRPEFGEAYNHRALCLFYTKEYSKSISDINKALSLKAFDPSELINLRGINYNCLGNRESACRDFKIAGDKGNQGAKDNYLKFCAGVSPRK